MYEIESFLNLSSVSDVEKIKLLDKLLETEKDFDVSMDLRMMKSEIQKKYEVVEEEDRDPDEYDLEGDCLNCSA